MIEAILLVIKNPLTFTVEKIRPDSQFYFLFMKRILLLLSVVGLWSFASAQCPPATPLATPFYENFDSQAGGQTGVYANCWTATTTADPNWETETSGTANSSSTGPLNDYSGTGVYVFLETSSGSAGDTSGLITPAIDLSSLTTPELRFYYHMYGATMGTLSVQVWNGLAWTTEWTISGEQHSSETAPWTEAIVDLSSYSGIIQLKFLGSKGGSTFTGDMSIDEVSIAEAPACPQPTGLAASNITSTGADLNWNSVVAATSGYDVIYGATGFNPASAGTVAAAATNSYTIGGLSGNTTYDAYVVSDCGVSGTSDTTGPVTFTTLCSSQLSGTVTIDASMPASATNFQTFAALAAELNQCGVGGAVTVNVKEGTYNEQVTFGSFIGSSSTNTVTIQADPSNTMPVVLTYSPTTSATTENFTLMIDGAMNMNISGLTLQSGGTTYSRVVQFAGNSDNVNFTGNTITGPSVTTTSTFNALMYYLNPATLSNSNISNNTFNNGSYVTYLSFTTAPLSDVVTISDNTVNGSYSGFYISNIKNATFTNNIINLASSTTTQYGVRLYGSSSTPSERVVIEGNEFNLNTTGTTYGAYIGYYVASAMSPSSIANNFISNSATTGTGTRYMIYPYACDYLNIFHNSINLQDGSATSGRALYLNTSTSATIISGNVDVRNNIISHTGPGYVVEIATSAVTTGYVTNMNYNLYNYDASNTTPLRYGSTNYADRAAWQVASTFDAMSVEGDPVFTSSSDLHVLGTAANDVGDNTAGVTVDIDGESRPAAGSTTVDIGADEYTPASCAPPSGVTAYNTTSTSTMLTWTTGGAANWVVEYGATGFTQGTGMKMNATNDTVMLSSLMSQTTYDVYVKDSCSASSTSPWVGPISFTTLCAPFVAPYMENFDGLALVSPYTDLPACWETQVGPDYWDVTDDVVNNGHTYLPNIGDHTTGSSNYMWIDASSNITANEMVTPLIDMSGLTAPMAGFWFASNNTNNAINHTINLDVWDGMAWVNIATQSGNFPGWVEVSGLVPGTVPTTTKFRIQAIANPSGTSSDYYFNDLGVDDFFVIQAPTCPMPSNAGVASTDDQSAVIYWTSGGASDWNIEYGVAGFTPGTGMSMNATNDTVTLTGLTSATNYEYYVRDSCGVGDVSMWVGPVSFSTAACAASATCTYTADLYDSFGDGWNGGIITFWQGGVAVGSMGSNFTGGNDLFDEPIDLCDGMMTYVTVSNPGSYSYEMGVYVKNRAGDTVSTYAPTGTPGTPAAGDTIGMFTVDCSVCPVFSAPFTEDFEASSPSATCWTNEYVADMLDWTLATGAGGGVITMAHGGTQNARFVSANGGPDITRFVSPVIDISGLAAPELRFWYGQEVWFSDQNFLNVYYRTSAMGAWTLIWSDSTNQPAWTEAIVALPMPGATYQLAFEGINNWGRANVLDDVTIMDAPACPAPSMLGVTNVTDNSADVYWTGGGSAMNWLVKYDDGTTANIVASANDTITLTGLMAGTGYTVHVKDSCGMGNVSVWAGPLTFTTAVCAPANSCNYSAQLSDSFGDGWNGTEVTVYQNGVAVAVLGPGFTTGFTFGPVSIPLCDGIATDFVITNANTLTYPEEIGIDLNDPYSSLVASYPANPAAAQGDTVLSLVASCAAPACAPPSNLGAYNVTTNSADLFWTGVSGAMMYNVQYGPQGFAPGTGTIVNSANDTLNLTGLSASMCYDFWVQSDCGTDSSIYVGPFTFCTLCAAISTFPYMEDFNSSPVSTLPACYEDSATNANGSFNWYVNSGGTTSGSTGPGADADGTATGNYVYTEASSPAATGDSAFLFLPEFDITSLTNPELVFAYHMYGADITTLTIEYFDAMSSSWMAIDSIVGQQQAASIDPWAEQRIALSAYSSSSLWLRFLHVRGASFNGDAAIDNVVIREIPQCVDPTGLAVTGVGMTSISLSWMTDTNITASAVQYGAPGFTLGSGTTMGSMAGMATVTGLMMNTCYDFYVLDSCGSATNWVGPVTACTKPGCGVSGIPTNVMDDSTGCGGGGVTLTAQAPAGMTLAWFTGGQLVGSGSPFIDTIGVTTMYDVHNVSRDGSAYHLGPQPSIAASGFGNFTNGQYITVMDTLVIDSTTVRSNGYVRAQVIITDGLSVTDGGNILQRGEIFTTDSNNTVNTQVPVGIVLTPGQYFIGIDFLPGTVGALFRATAGAVYPYTFPGLMSIDSVNFAGPRYYYTFDLVIQNACIGVGSAVATGYVPGANAGTSDSVTVCETETAVDLTQFLGTYDAGGTWSDDDATGALTDSIFDASAVMAGGTYNFTYIVTQSGGCTGGDTATVSVTVEASPFAGNDTTNVMCITGAPLQLRALLPGSDNGGTMTDLDGSGALVGTLFLPGNLSAAGTYRFRYVVDGTACPNDTAMITMVVDTTVDAGPDAMDTIKDCMNPIDLNTYLGAGASAGGTWVDVSGSGALTGSSFDPSAVGNQASYDFRYVLNSACGDDSATVSLYIDCPIGLGEFTVGKIDVYPNPTRGEVTIEALTNGTKIQSVEVYAINGELLIQRTVGDKTVRIDLSGYADGLYNVKVTSDQGVELHRINKK